MSARPSEIRAFLLRYAKKRGILVQEHTSGLLEGDGPVTYFCHLQSPTTDPLKTATAISQDGQDNALVMAFLNFSDSSIDFLD